MPNSNDGLPLQMQVEEEIEDVVDAMDTSCHKSRRSQNGDESSMEDESKDDFNADDIDDDDDEDDDDLEDLLEGQKLDCYPYTFTPLLLFAPADYFDKGYSNYNSVARFFEPITKPRGVDMLENVLFDRKNMLYEVLMDHVIQNQMLVVCCIDAHFTAFQVLKGNAHGPQGASAQKATGIYYDPLKPRLYRVTGDSFRLVLAYLLLKCNYGDSQHIQDNSDHYTGVTANPTRRIIYKLWRKINLTPSPADLHGVSWSQAPIHNAKGYFLVNDSKNHKYMSVQRTGNTCYFQTYL